MKKTVLLFFAVVLFMLLSYSQKETSPSSRVIAFYEAMERGDTQALQKVMTKGAYARLLGQYTGQMKGEGKVFAYDCEHFAEDPDALRRMNERFDRVLKAVPKQYVPVLISQDAPDENSRRVHYAIGEEEKAMVLVLENGGWRIESF